MLSKPLRCITTVALVILSASAVRALDVPWFHETDPLCDRSEWGVRHQTGIVYPTDFYPRYESRWNYYVKSRHQLLADPAYVAALQNVMRKRGYYCGQIDGVMSQAVSDAIARVQKNHTQRVTGELTIAVRRVLNLP